MKFKQYLNEYTKHKLSYLISMRAVPLSEPMLDRLGYTFKTDAYHVTNAQAHLKELYRHQKSKAQISTFTKGDYTLARLPSQPDILCDLSGTAVMEAKSDMWSITDTQGRRWIDQTNRVKNNKLTFMINGYLQKIIQQYTPDIDIEKTNPKNLEKIIKNLNTKQRSVVYKEYIDMIERYLDSGGYKDLSDYLKKSAELGYNEVILTNYIINKVRCIDYDSPHILALISELGLNYGGVISSRDFKTLIIK